jgi:RNA polymerase sigma-70 factor (ECF subfamily)
MTDALAVSEQPSDIGLDELYPRIWRYVLSVVRDVAEAEDLTQETFLRAHSRRGSLRDVDAALPWLYAIATHVCLDRLRQRARRAARESAIEPEAVASTDVVPSAELRVEQAEMSACVQGYVGELSDGYRAVLLLHAVHGLTCPQIAALLDESPGAVKIRLHRARKRLQGALQTGCTFSHDERGALVCEPKAWHAHRGVSLGPSSVVALMSNRMEDTMSKRTRILTRAALAGVAAAVARRLVPRAHEACRAHCGGACGPAADRGASQPITREVQHAA